MKRDQMFKVLILGDPSVGKSCLLLQYCDAIFQPTHIATVGIDFKMKLLNIEDQTVKMQLWDTAGQERFQTLASTLYKGAMGIVLVYSVDNRKAFDGISRWIKQIKENTNESISVILVANKSDLPNKQVSTADGRRLAEQYQLDFFEVSAMTGENVKATFESLAFKIFSQMKQNPPPQTQEQDQGKNQQFKLPLQLLRKNNVFVVELIIFFVKFNFFIYFVKLKSYIKKQIKAFFPKYRIYKTLYQKFYFLNSYLLIYIYIYSIKSYNVKFIVFLVHLKTKVFLKLKQF